jgi:NAD(P)-dependent dehydrogenase (short-subunit alcohol dehydrogenase family)
MELDLAGKRAFVSGSTQGIGYAIAETLLREGAAVIVNGRTDGRVDATVDALRAAVPGAEVTGIAADFADPEQVRRLLGSLGDVDILVNNVGVFEVKEFTDITDDDWHRYFDVNVMSGVRLSRQLIGRMLETGWGRVVFVSSESGVNVPGDMIHYGATKAAVLALGNGLAKLTRSTGVTVNTVLGGPTYSDGVARAVTQIARAQNMRPEDLKGAIAAGNRTSLLQRFIEPSEIADLVAYLASPRSSATNGAALRADGGTLTSIL